MTEIILTSEQTRLLAVATDRVVIADASGNVIVSLPPERLRHGLAAMRAMVHEAEEDASAGRVGHFDVEETMLRVEERLATDEWELYFSTTVAC